MNHILLPGAFAIGILLGGFYFGGLWITVNRLQVASQPALTLVASFLVRVSVVLGSISLVSGDRWERILACLVGFLIARSLLIRKLAGPSRFAYASALPLNTDARDTDQ